MLGEPFAQVFKPILATVIDALNGFLEFVRAMPATVKKGLAAFFVGAGAIISVVGAAIAAKAAIALLIIGLKAAGVTVGGLVAVLLPAILVVAAIGIAVAGLYIAFQNAMSRAFAAIAPDSGGKTWKQVVEDCECRLPAPCRSTRSRARRDRRGRAAPHSDVAGRRNRTSSAWPRPRRRSWMFRTSTSWQCGCSPA